MLKNKPNMEEKVMKKKLLSMICLLLTLCILFVSCDDNQPEVPNDPTEAPTEAPNQPEQEPDNEPYTVTETYLPKNAVQRLTVLFESGASKFASFSPSVGRSFCSSHIQVP